VISTSLTVWWSVTHVDDMGTGPWGGLGGGHVAVADWSDGMKPVPLVAVS
jgi:hypothetical protein